MAKTREEYMNAETLKKRLQTIAFSIGPKLDEKSTKSSSDKNEEKQQQRQPPHLSQKLSTEAQHRINQLRNKNRQVEKSLDNHGISTPTIEQMNKRLSESAIPQTLDDKKRISQSSEYHSAINELQSNLIQAAHGNKNQKRRKVNDEIDKKTAGLSEKQRKKVIRQQQQRLILLRHASKCRAGMTCEIKFCAQMVKLWNHMKKCRDKHCSTPHCLSSRCVLNHYKICKDENRTATCEVCAPVTEVIHFQESQQNNAAKGQQQGSDPFVKILERNDESKEVLPKKTSLPDAPTRSENPMAPSKGFNMYMLPPPLRAKFEKLEKQYKLMMHLKQQQDLEMQQLLRNNISPYSIMGIKLRDKRAILQKCQEQYAQDKRYLEDLIKKFQEELNNKQNLPTTKAVPDMKNNNFNDSLMLSSTSVNPDIIKNDILNSSASGITTKTFNVFEPDSDLLVDTLGKDPVKDLAKDPFKDDVTDFDFEPLFGDNDDSLSLGTGLKRKLDELQPDDFLTEDSANAFVEMFDFSQNDEHDEGSEKQDEGISFDMVKLDSVDSVDGSMSLNHLNPLEEFPSDISKNVISDTMVNSKDDSANASKTMLPLVKKILEDPFGWLFRDPVDPVELCIPDYFEIIKNPMDLSLIEKRLKEGYYKTIASAKKDVILVFDNAIQYNGEDSDVGQMAVKLMAMFNSDCRALSP